MAKIRASSAISANYSNNSTAGASGGANSHCASSNARSSVALATPGAVVNSAKGADDGVRILGTEYVCKWADGSRHIAVPVKFRTSSEGKALNEYYVHYVGEDHRLDEWVDGRRLMSDASSSRTVTPSPEPPGEIMGHSKVKNIDSVILGKHEIDTWYYSPYPNEYCVPASGKNGGGSAVTILLCEFCLKYFSKRKTLERHAQKCTLRHPPGAEIYREGNISVFEVSGGSEKAYCQNLCLLSKLFLDHKTLCYDVDHFSFYVLAECDRKGFHIIGYFSKELDSPDGYNLACIMTLPPYQKQGYGNFLISLSYELTKHDGKTGTPEKPLSDLGLLSYRSFWSSKVLSVLTQLPTRTLTVREISAETGISCTDVCFTLRSLGIMEHEPKPSDVTYVHVPDAVIARHVGESGLKGKPNIRQRVCDTKKFSWAVKR